VTLTGRSSDIVLLKQSVAILSIMTDWSSARLRVPALIATISIISCFRKIQGGLIFLHTFMQTLNPLAQVDTPLMWL